MVRHIEVLALIAASAVAAVAAGCDSTDPSDEAVFVFDFTAEDHSFEADFTDVAVEQEGEVGFDAGHRPLPSPLSGGGLFQAGLNVSDDLFMLFRRRVEGLLPGERYRVSFTLEIASAVHEGCEVGVGTSVWVKAGASEDRPERMVVFRNGRDEIRLTVDKGEQMNSGTAALLLDDIRNGLPGCPGGDPTWDRESIAAGGLSLDVVADEDGGIWLFFGTESGFEVSHEIFFTRFRAVLSPI